MEQRAGTGHAGQPAAARPRGVLGRVRHVIVALWGAVTGVAPHVLHHVGPLAGTALVSGVTGRLLFVAIGLGATIPFLLRLYRRFNTWAAPAIALVVFVVMFLLSTFVIGPLLTGERSLSPPPDVNETEPADHEEHEHD